MYVQADENASTLNPHSVSLIAWGSFDQQAVTSDLSASPGSNRIHKLQLDCSTIPVSATPIVSIKTIESHEPLYPHVLFYLNCELSHALEAVKQGKAYIALS